MAGALSDAGNSRATADCTRPATSPLKMWAVTSVASLPGSDGSAAPLVRPVVCALVMGGG
jgi:hypothetical protein